MRTALLFVIVVAMVATGLWLFVAGLFFESETNIWYVVSGGWLIGLGGDRLWRDFVAPVGLRRDMNRAIALHQMRPVVDRVPWMEARAALQYMREGKHFGKIVLKF